MSAAGGRSSGSYRALSTMTETSSGRLLAPLPARSGASSYAKPASLPPFESMEAIVQTLDSRDIPTLLGGLHQLEKRAMALVAKAAPRAEADIVLDYLKRYPGVEGVFAAWEYAHKIKSSPLSASSISTLSALIRLVSTDPFSSDPAIIRRILSDFPSHLERALNPGRNDVTTAALKLCNVVVGFGSGRFARKLFNSMQWQAKVTTRLFRTRLRDSSRDPLRKPDIRTLLVMLVLAFLSGDSRLKVEVLETKGLLSGILKGLSEDPDVVVNYVLITLGRDVVGDRRIGLEARRNIFDENCVLELIKLYSSTSDSESLSPRISVNRLFYLLTDWLAIQIASNPSRSFGPQKVLGTILRSLAINEDTTQRELALHILTRAPILASGFWSKFPSSLDPRLSSRWISTVTFATQVVALPTPQALTPAITSTTAPPSLQSTLDNIIPPALGKQWFTKSLQHESPLVSFLASILLLAALQKATRVLESIVATSKSLEEDARTGRWAALAIGVRKHLRSVVPEAQIVVAFMQKKAVAPSPAKLGEKRKKHSAETDEVPSASDDVERYLKTNVALRLLWLYHRVVPSMIEGLRFDFAKLPQAHVHETVAEGVRAISSAYALRLASLHSGGVTWARPGNVAHWRSGGQEIIRRLGDYFKSTLAPLFQLSRAPSTPSNRQLLLSILSRLLSTPALFGDDSTEVDIWFSALATLTRTDVASSRVAFDCFEQCVQRALVSPVRAADGEGDDYTSDARKSPLLAIFLDLLPTQVEKEDLGTRVLSFVQVLVLSFFGHYDSEERIAQLVSTFDVALKKVKGAKATVTNIHDCLKVLLGKAKKRTASKLDISDCHAANPLKANIFVAAAQNGELHQGLVGRMPLELVLLHLLPSEPSDPVFALVVESVRDTNGWSRSTQLLLHRFLSSGTTSSESNFFGNLIARIVSTSPSHERLHLKDRVAGSQQSIRLLTEDASRTSSIAALVAGILTPTDPHDAALARPYCSALVTDLSSRCVESQTNTSRRTNAIVHLLPFFSEEEIESMTALLLSVTVFPLPADNRDLLSTVLDRFTVYHNHTAQYALWDPHFATLHRLATEGIEAAQDVLSIGSRSLLPFDKSALSLSKKLKPSDETLEGWSELLFANQELQAFEAAVVAAFVYRSPTVRFRFRAWIEGYDGANAVDIEQPVVALLDVALALGEDTTLPAAIVSAFVDSALAEHAAAQRVVELMCAACKDSTRGVEQRVMAWASDLARDTLLPSTLAFLSRLCDRDSTFFRSLQLVVDKAFETLVRRFAEEQVDADNTITYVVSLANVLERHGTRLSITPHLVDPFITAAITRRLDQPQIISLVEATIKQHVCKDNEVARYLNEIFASQSFLTLLRDGTNSNRAVLSLATTLAHSAPKAATSSRFVEKTMSLYRATLSTIDVNLIKTFACIEAIGGSVPSDTVRRWNPSNDIIASTSSRWATIGSLQASQMRRSWLWCFASSMSQPFLLEQSAQTYDPNFILPFLRSALLQDDLKGSEWEPVLASGSLGLAIAALASSSPATCLLGRNILAIAQSKIEASSALEKDEMLLVLNHARNGVYSAEGEPIPAVVALFLAECITSIGNPQTPLYPVFNKFLLQRPLLDQRDVPLFYILFFSSGDDPDSDHQWIVRFLTDGLVRSQDWRIYRRRQVFELFIGFFDSYTHAAALRKLILQFLVRATSIPVIARELLSRNGLLSWMSTVTPHDAAEQRLLNSILGNIVTAVRHPSAVEVLDAMIRQNAGAQGWATSEFTMLCSIIAKMSLLELDNTGYSTHRSLMALTSSLELLQGHLPPEPEAKTIFYETVMLAMYARNTRGIKEGDRERRLFAAAVEAGLDAGVEPVRAHILATTSKDSV